MYVAVVSHNDKHAACDEIGENDENLGSRLDT